MIDLDGVVIDRELTCDLIIQEVHAVLGSDVDPFKSLYLRGINSAFTQMCFKHRTNPIPFPGRRLPGTYLELIYHGCLSEEEKLKAFPKSYMLGSRVEISKEDRSSTAILRYMEEEFGYGEFNEDRIREVQAGIFKITLMPWESYTLVEPSIAWKVACQLLRLQHYGDKHLLSGLAPIGYGNNHEPNYWNVGYAPQVINHEDRSVRALAIQELQASLTFEMPDEIRRNLVSGIDLLMRTLSKIGIPFRYLLGHGFEYANNALAEVCDKWKGFFEQSVIDGTTVEHIPERLDVGLYKAVAAWQLDSVSGSNSIIAKQAMEQAVVIVNLSEVSDDILNADYNREGVSYLLQDAGVNMELIGKDRVFELVEALLQWPVVTTNPLYKDKYYQPTQLEGVAAALSILDVMERQVSIKCYKPKVGGSQRSVLQAVKEVTRGKISWNKASPEIQEFWRLRVGFIKYACVDDPENVRFTNHWHNELAKMVSASLRILTTEDCIRVPLTCLMPLYDRVFDEKEFVGQDEELIYLLGLFRS